MKLLSDYELLLFVNRYSKERKIRFSPAECAFFVSLAKFIHSSGSVDESRGKHYVQLSCRDLSLHLDYSTTFVFSTLQKFDGCGLVERVRVPGGSDSLGSYNKSSFTYMDLSSLCSAD